MDRIEECGSDHYYHRTAIEATLTLTSEATGPILLVTADHTPYAEVRAPAAALVSPAQPVFLHITPIPTTELAQHTVVIADALRAEELGLQQVVPLSAVQVSPAVEIQLEALEEETSISTLLQPIEIAFIHSKEFHLKASTIYDHHLYHHPLDVQKGELCPARHVLTTWRCLEKEDYQEEDGLLRVRVRSSMRLAVIIAPGDHLENHSSMQETVSELIARHLINTQYIAIPIFLLCMGLVVYAMRWRIQWEQEKDRFTIMRIRADRHATVLYEMTHTQPWTQSFVEDGRGGMTDPAGSVAGSVAGNVAGSVSGVGRKGEVIKNPLAMRKTMNEVIEKEMREVQETTRRNEELISQLRSEKKALDVGI